MENCQVTGSKLKRKNEVALVEQNNLIIDEKTLRKTFSGFFFNDVVRLGINRESNVSNDDISNYYLDEFIYRYNNHPSILSLKKDFWI